MQSGDALLLRDGVALDAPVRYTVHRDGQSSLTFSSSPLLLAWLRLTVDPKFSRDRLYTVLAGVPRKTTTRMLAGLTIEKS